MNRSSLKTVISSLEKVAVEPLLPDVAVELNGAQQRAFNKFWDWGEKAGLKNFETETLQAIFPKEVIGDIMDATGRVGFFKISDTGEIRASGDSRFERYRKVTDFEGFKKALELDDEE
ncbi:unnamed protein product [marine sediment metagenome]|uniref:Uncharacterized protein n=1 Tax=marine sediment metagenome TaxID=412755 RepID=X0WBC7_9ZZZZ